MDIVERLRNLEWMIDQKELNEAADEIERLREALRKVDVSNADNEIERLRGALQHCVNAMSETAIWLGALDHAHKALEGKE
jgi:uncharacterized membrane protein (DUF106 family)